MVDVVQPNGQTILAPPRRNGGGGLRWSFQILPGAVALAVSIGGVVASWDANSTKRGESSQRYEDRLSALENRMTSSENDRRNIHETLDELKTASLNLVQRASALEGRMALSEGDRKNIHDILDEVKAVASNLTLRWGVLEGRVNENRGVSDSTVTQLRSFLDTRFKEAQDFTSRVDEQSASRRQGLVEEMRNVVATQNQRMDALAQSITETRKDLLEAIRQTMYLRGMLSALSRQSPSPPPPNDGKGGIQPQEDGGVGNNSNPSNNALARNIP